MINNKKCEPSPVKINIGGSEVTAPLGGQDLFVHNPPDLPSLKPSAQERLYSGIKPLLEKIKARVPRAQEIVTFYSFEGSKAVAAKILLKDVYSMRDRHAIYEAHDDWDGDWSQIYCLPENKAMAITITTCEHAFIFFGMLDDEFLLSEGSHHPNMSRRAFKHFKSMCGHK